MGGNAADADDDDEYGGVLNGIWENLHTHTKRQKEDNTEKKITRDENNVV